jgi:hypothetical protein
MLDLEICSTGTLSDQFAQVRREIDGITYRPATGTLDPMCCSSILMKVVCFASRFFVVLQIDLLQHLRNAEVMLRETPRQATGIIPIRGHNRLAICAAMPSDGCCLPVVPRPIARWHTQPTSLHWPGKISCRSWLVFKTA